MLELVIENIPCCSSVMLPPSSPIAHPVTPSMQASIHHPSRMLRLSTPLSAAFMPLVPDASSGGKGVLSHRSSRQPASWRGACRNREESAGYPPLEGTADLM